MRDLFRGAWQDPGRHRTSRPRRSAVQIAGLCFACAETALAQTTTQPTSNQVATHLEIQTSSFVDLHFLVRTCAAGSAEAPEIDGMTDAVQCARDLDKSLAGPLAWGLIEAVFSTCTSVAEARDACGESPEHFRTRSGQIVQLRREAIRLLETHTPIEAAYRERLWPGHLQTIERAARQLQNGLLPKQAACLAEIFERLELPDPHARVPIYLVAKSPPPGGATHRRRGIGVCFVSVEKAEEAWSLLYEMILHEAIHAIDVAAQGQPTALADLKRRLSSAGVAPRNPANRNTVHTLVFVQAAETVRSFIDPAHRHYGDVRGYYDRVGPAAHSVRRWWTQYLDGEIRRDEALERIAEQVAQ